MRLDELEESLQARPLTSNVRRGIRRARIAVIDDQVEQLGGLLDGLRSEGFTNLIEISVVRSVHEIIEADYDLVVLDHVGVAQNLTDRDGVGVLTALKKADPSLPVLVLSGNAVTLTLAVDLASADTICTKPIFPADLAAEIEDLLKGRMGMSIGALWLSSKNSDHWARMALRG